MNAPADRFTDAYLNRLLAEVHREDVEAAHAWQQARDTAASRPYLEITLELDADTSPSAAFLVATRLISVIDSAAPELELQYDGERSHAADHTVVVALTPRNASDDGRMEELAAELQREVRVRAGMNLIGCRWKKAG